MELEAASRDQTEVLGKSDILALEPSLGPNVECGVFTPQWSHINDPKHLVTVLRTWLQAQGVVVMPSAVSSTDGTEPVTVRLMDGRCFTAPRSWWPPAHAARGLHRGWVPMTMINAFDASTADRMAPAEWALIEWRPR